MELKVKAIPNSSKQEVKEQNGILKIYLNSPHSEGRANKELIEVLTKHFKVKKSQIEIIRGAHSREKTVRLNI
jgi:uncharacterized protein